MSAMFLLSIFIVLEMNIFVEAHLEYKPEDLEESIIKNEDYDITVDINNDNAQYKSIQSAIDNVQPDSTIYVKVGAYSEIINICKKIYLIGEDKDKTFINPVSKKNGYAVRIAAKGVELSGFSINNKGSGLYTTGIKISAAQVTIEDCNIFGTPVGIAIWSSENTISNCKFWGCEDEGIAFLGSSATECNNNLVTNCEFYNNCDGIELQYSSNNTISNCEFHDNTHAAIDAIGSNNNDNTIQNCDIFDNGGYGIYFSRSSGNKITQCSLSNNKIMSIESRDTLITESFIDAIYLLDDSSAVIQDCDDLDESHIKAIESEYEITHRESADDDFDMLKEEKHYRYSIIARILDILNTIKIRFRNSLYNSFY